jgi:hypothetical protein
MLKPFELLTPGYKRHDRGICLFLGRASSVDPKRIFSLAENMSVDRTIFASENDRAKSTSNFCVREYV